MNEKIWPPKPTAPSLVKPTAPPPPKCGLLLIPGYIVGITLYLATMYLTTTHTGHISYIFFRHEHSMQKSFIDCIIILSLAIFSNSFPVILFLCLRRKIFYMASGLLMGSLTMMLMLIAFSLIMWCSSGPGHVLQ